jgi:hypothetical protein
MPLASHGVISRICTMPTSGLTDALHRITPEQLAAAERTRQYWAGRQLVHDDAAVSAGAEFGVGSDAADEEAEDAPAPMS